MTNLYTATVEFILWDLFSSFDNGVYDIVSSHMTEGLTRIMRFFTFCGSEWTITALAVAFPAFVFAFRKKRLYRWSIAASANIALGALLNQALKYVFLRERPGVPHLVEVSGYSFPSGHSMNSLIFYGFFIYFILKNMKHRSKYAIAALLGLLVPMIGISRIYLGVHYASDVLAGFLVGIGWLVLFIKMSDRYIQRSNYGN